MGNDKYSLEDLVAASFNEKPVDFADAFNGLLQDKLTAAVADKKIEIAQNLYRQPEVETETTEEE